MEVIVVLNHLEGGGIAVHAEMMDGDWVGEEGLDRCEVERLAGEIVVSERGG